MSLFTKLAGLLPRSMLYKMAQFWIDRVIKPRGTKTKRQKRRERVHGAKRRG
jgi:hypothetical protein